MGSAIEVPKHPNDRVISAPKHSQGGVIEVRTQSPGGVIDDPPVEVVEVVPSRTSQTPSFPGSSCSPPCFEYSPFSPSIYTDLPCAQPSIPTGRFPTYSGCLTQIPISQKPKQKGVFT